MDRHGANLLQVSRWLGHSTVQITAVVYGHLFPETNDLVIGRLDKTSEPHSPSPWTPQPPPTTRTPAQGSRGLSETLCKGTVRNFV